MSSEFSLKRNARTFFLASIFLSRVNYIKCSNLYNFCRYVDDLVDKKINNYTIKLNNIERQLRRKDEITDRNVSSINFLIEKKMINFRNLLELIKGIRFDNRMNYLKKKKELINYSYLVAGTVGVMLCDLFSINNKQAYKFAVDLGIAMQLTNIARDVLEDAKIQRVYIPSEWVKLNINEILHPNFNSKKKIMIGTKKGVYETAFGFDITQHLCYIYGSPSGSYFYEGTLDSDATG